jgi:hypothetical protein
MSRRQYVILYLASLLIWLLLSSIQKTPGYMDAAYYSLMGKQIASSNMGSEPFIWTYLANPPQIPNTSFTYWMPLTSFIAALGMLLFHSQSFMAARFFFIVLAASVPILNILLAKQFTQSRWLNYSAGFLGITAGFYSVYFTIPDSFVLYCVLGAIYFLLLLHLFSRQKSKKIPTLVFALGVTAGLMHLTRADGILWLFGVFLALWIVRKEHPFSKSFQYAILAVIAYILTLAPWFIRNLLVFHWIFPPGSNLSIFFINYNDLFSFPPEKLTLVHLLSTGIGTILLDRLQALVSNLGTWIGVAGLVILAPFGAYGLWLNRKHKIIQFYLLMLGLLTLVMSFVFPYAGTHGGFFHSLSAFQCLLWALIPIGFAEAIARIAVWRKWKPERSLRLLGSTLLVITLLLSVGFFASKTMNGKFDEQYNEFARLGQFLHLHGISDDQIIMVNDSPGFTLMTGYSAIQMTSGSLSDALCAMNKYQAEYLVISPDHTPEFDAYYVSERDDSSFKFLGRFENFMLYQVAGS